MSTQKVAVLPASSRKGISVRQLREADLEAADSIFRHAFDTFTGIPNLFGTRDYVHTRWHTHPEAAIAADIDGALVGTNFVSHWGTFGFFGPLSVRSDLWDRGIAKALMESTLDLFEALGTRREGLFTFPQSAKHIGLYQRFGFWPRYLTPILSKPVVPQDGEVTFESYSELPPEARESYEKAAVELTGTLLEGLDLRREIRSLERQGIGDTLFLTSGSRLEGLAVCHIGPGSEAGAEACYIKFGMVRSSGRSRLEFDRLLRATEKLALERGAQRIEVGVSMECRGAGEALLAQGYRAGMIGVTMERPQGAAYHRADAWVMSDWR